MAQSILVVEDEEYIRDLYKRQLEIAGYAVDVAINGKQALDMIAKTPYEVILLDVMMPELTGIDVLKKIDLKKNNPTLKVVMLTNLGQDDIIKQAFELGAAGYLIKLSINPNNLVDEVKKFIKS